GQAEGEAEFARICSMVWFERTSKAFPLRSFLPEIQVLQDKTNAEFKPPRSIELHSRFIALNATMKAARELDAAKLYAGALYQYLEATRNFGMLDVVPPEGAKLDELRQSVAAMRQKIAASKDDHSILQIFVERAEAAQSKDELRSALVIVDHV